MPRFDVKTLLLVFAVVALWLSTFTSHFFANEVRNLILYAILLISGLSAFCFRGRRQMFWLGFFATMLLFMFGSSAASPPHLRWCAQLYISYKPAHLGSSLSAFDNGVIASMALWLILICSTVMGFVGMRIYDQSQKATAE